MRTEEQLRVECDRLAARHWERAAGDRVKTYQEWQKACQKYADFIEQLKKKDSK
jgi:uncharacterized protein YukE